MAPRSSDPNAASSGDDDGQGPTVTAVTEPDLAEALELRDELLLACREVLLTVGTRHAASLVASIDALLDLDDEASPGSQR